MRCLIRIMFAVAKRMYARGNSRVIGIRSAQLSVYAHVASAVTSIMPLNKLLLQSAARILSFIALDPVDRRDFSPDYSRRAGVCCPKFGENQPVALLR